MDETLVNFDPGRIRNTARVLAAFARENQILAFTCHSRLADILLEAGEQAAGPVPSSFSIAQGVISRQ
jgi:uncharacterized protein YhaN